MLERWRGGGAQLSLVGLPALPAARLFAAFAEDYFGPLPERPTRRVVVTGLGLATPIGVGVLTAERALNAGSCGIRALSASDLPQVPPR